MSERLLRLVGTATVTALTAGALLTTAPTPVVAAPAPPSTQDRSIADLLTDLRRLHREAGKAAAAYGRTGQELRKQRAEVARLDHRLAKARLALHHSRGAAGRLARQQYQNSSTELSPYVRLLMSRDPHRALEQGHVIRQVAQERAVTVERLVGNEQDTAALARRARRALDRQLTLTEHHRRQHTTASTHLNNIQTLLTTLPPTQLAKLKKSEQKGPTR